MKKRDVILWFLAVAGITLIALILRIWAVRKLPTDLDERTYVRASSFYAQAIQQNDWSGLSRIDVNQEHPSFVKLFNGVFLSGQKLIFPIRVDDMEPQQFLPSGIIKDMLMTVRNVSMVFGVLAVAILAAFNPIAGLFLAVHSFAVKYTSEAYLEAIPSVTSLLAALAYLRWIRLVERQPKPLAVRNSLRIHVWLGLSGAAMGLTLASKYSFGIVGVAILVHFAWVSIQKKYPRKKAALFLAAYGMIAALVFFAGDIYLWQDPVRKLISNIHYHLQFANRQTVKTRYPAWQIFYWLSKPISQHSTDDIHHLGNDILLGLDLPISLLAIIGLPRLFKRNLLFFLWLIISLGFLFVWQNKWPQYAMIVIPPLCLSASEGFHLIFLDPLVRLITRVQFKTKVSVR